MAWWESWDHIKYCWVSDWPEAQPELETEMEFNYTDQLNDLGRTDLRQMVRQAEWPMQGVLPSVDVPTQRSEDDRLASLLRILRAHPSVVPGHWDAVADFIKAVWAELK
jgi:hypothetical protein